MSVSTNRSDIELPVEISKNIIQTIQEDSAVMKLSNSTPIPARGMEIPVILGDPDAYWVGETEKIKVSNPTFEHRLVKPYKMGVIVPFSNEFRRDYDTLYNAVRSRLPRVLSKKFDNTCFGNEDAPGDGFDTLKSATTQDFETDPYKALVAARSDISQNLYDCSGFLLSTQAEDILLLDKDSTGRPIFNGTETSDVPRILSIPTLHSKAAYAKGTPNVLGFAGDWRYAEYGLVNAITINLSDQATLEYNGTTINLWQQDMFALKCTMEVGFVAQVKAFNKLVGKAA